MVMIAWLLLFTTAFALRSLGYETEKDKVCLTWIQCDKRSCALTIVWLQNSWRNKILDLLDHVDSSFFSASSLRTVGRCHHGHDRMVVVVYNCLCTQCLSPLKLWVQIIVRCTRYCVINLSVTCDKVSGYVNQYNWPPGYSWNIQQQPCDHDHDGTYLPSSSHWHRGNIQSSLQRSPKIHNRSAIT
jgi:hypothetical protein